MNREPIRTGDLATLDTFAGPLAVRVVETDTDPRCGGPYYGLMRAGDTVRLDVTATRNRSYRRGETIDANPLRLLFRRH